MNHRALPSASEIDEASGVLKQATIDGFVRPTVAEKWSKEGLTEHICELIITEDAVCYPYTDTRCCAYLDSRSRFIWSTKGRSGDYLNINDRRWQRVISRIEQNCGRK